MMQPAQNARPSTLLEQLLRVGAETALRPAAARGRASVRGGPRPRWRAFARRNACWNVPGCMQGGKSTLLRSMSVCCILAHIGAPVPAASLRLSPVDAVFTRLGATDRILSGESTFMIECAETAAVLHAATARSLVILDELGRGTSTFDGYAIAGAVLRELLRGARCRMLFATHYHPLTAEFEDSAAVQMGHMGARCAAAGPHMHAASVAVHRNAVHCFALYARYRSLARLTCGSTKERARA